ncbi:MAG TPA: spore germination protein [Selenomonadales bacterium]|nr:spore germination protein [Selenomonadales bacterium]
MEETLFSKIGVFLNRMLVFQPPKLPSRFVLEEKSRNDSPSQAEDPLKKALAELEALIRYGRRLQATLEKTRAALQGNRWDDERKVLRAEYTALEKQRQELNPLVLAYDVQTDNAGERPVSTSLTENRRLVEALYRLPVNKDLIVRDLTIGTAPPLKAMLIYLEGLTDGKIVGLMILQPLMLLSQGKRKATGDALIRQVMEELLPGNQVQPVGNFQDIQDRVNSGDTVVFLDGAAEALVVETKGWEHRGVGRPAIEQSIRGSQAAFAENLRVNTGLIRTMLRSSDLVTEMVPVGTRSRVNCAIMYLESVANADLVAEVKRRVSGFSTDYVDDSGFLEQFIEDKFILPLPQSLSTERPDRVASHLSEGRVAIITEGSPFALVVPVTFFTFFHSAEDFSLNPIAANFLRLLRVLGTFISIMLPALYIAITYFHQEALPTELALAIAGAREDVPFPAIFEVIMMELSFELIREAGVRIPGVLGSTIGIVGAIILGQAAVSAHIVSPIIVILVAITGLASSIIPEYRMALFARLSRFALLLLATFTGLVGLASGVLTIVVGLCSMKSYGVPYMAPIGPKVVPTLDVVVRGSAERRERRPDSLNTKDPTRQPYVSREWARKLPTGEEEK